MNRASDEAPWSDVAVAPARPRQASLLFHAGGGLLFVLLATANAAGYRFGVSDQAFYIPVVQRALDAEAFPRDAALIDAQGRLMLADELIAALVGTLGIPLEIVFLSAYLLSLALIWAGLLLIGSHVYRSAWATAALAAAFTLRHRIPRTSANTFEPYFHPRMLAFGLGMLAVAALLRRRFWTAIALVAVAAVVHITTAIWFALLLGVAMAILDRTLRRLALAGAAAAALFTAWAVTAGPLQASLTTMDAVWLQAVASKDSLFASQWPLWAWAANLALLAALWWALRRRQSRGEATAEDVALAWGATALVALFVITLPAVAAGVALPVQLQISRVFWMVDFLATVYVLAAIADRGRATGDARASQSPRPTRAMAVALLLVAVSAGRGAYIMLVERPERALFAVALGDAPWDDVMRWMAARPVDTHVLADPGHAWKYGTSVRVAAGRDVFLEEVKDSAIAMYSRDVAVRVVERTAAIGDFPSLTADRARELAARYDLDYLVTDADLPLPVAYRNQQFTVYVL